MIQENQAPTQNQIQVPKVEGFKNLEEYFTHMIAINGFESQNEILKKEGYTQLGKNFKLLIKFQGDVDKVREKLSKKHCQGTQFEQKRFKGSKDDAKEKMRQEGLYEKYEQIAQLGFDRPRRIYCLLKKFDGNVEQVVERLQSKEERHFHGRKHGSSSSEGHGHGHWHGHGHGRGRGRGRGRGGHHEGSGSHERKHGGSRSHSHDRGEKHKGCKFQDLDEKKKLLHDMGFTNGKKTFKALRRCKGDVEKAIQILVEEKSPEINQEFKKLKQEFEAKLIQMEEEGFYKRHKNVKLLAICNGDCQKATELLKEKFGKGQMKKNIQ